MWFAMVCLFCIFSRCIFPGNTLRWTLCLYFVPLPFLLCWPPSRLGYFHVGHRTWLHTLCICLLLVVPVCSFGIKSPTLSKSFDFVLPLRILSPPWAAPWLGSSFKTGSCVLSYQHPSLAINRQLCGNNGGTYMEHSSEDLARVALMTICKYREPNISQLWCFDTAKRSKNIIRVSLSFASVLTCVDQVPANCCPACDSFRQLSNCSVLREFAKNGGQQKSLKAAWKDSKKLGNTATLSLLGLISHLLWSV